MFEEIINTFLLDSDMTAIMSGLLIIFTLFNVFLIYRISNKKYAVIAVTVFVLISACFILFTISADFGIGMITMWASFVLVPLFVSQGLAFAIFKLIKAGKAAKIFTVAAAAALVALSWVFWPESLEEKIGNPVTPDAVYYYDSGTFTEKRVLDKTYLKNVVSQINCMPCVFTPEFSEDCIVMKLNDNYVLLAVRNEASYIFEHCGDIENFEPAKACYKVYRNKPLYISIKTS